MAERIGDVGHARGSAELARAAQSLLEVAEDRLTGHEK